LLVPSPLTPITPLLVIDGQRFYFEKRTPSAEALANLVMEAVKGLEVDVVVYDGEM
jgi:hypothetical protein